MMERKHQVHPMVLDIRLPWPWGIPNFETKPDEDAQNLMFNLG